MPPAAAAPAASGPLRVEKERGLFAELARRLRPTVVHIQVTTREVVAEASPFDAMPEEFRRFFGALPGPRSRPREGRGQGSGVVISPDGFILTNNHVVRGASEIKVLLADDRELAGRIIGTDPKTDLAVLKVDSERSLEAAGMGDSDALEVGDWVMAIGNPFGLSQTVTVGVVSGKGRVIGMDQYDQFIQTDASINPGNSGGPLFDTEGRVVGINTAIVSQGQGIGFAVPVNLARQVASQLQARGEVVRGYVGLQIQPLTTRMARALELPEGTSGALVGSVVPGGPGSKAGVQTGDVVVEFQGRPLKDDRELLNAVAAAEVGSRASLKILREGQARTLALTIARRPSEPQAEGAVEVAPQQGLGLGLRALTPALAAQLGVEPGAGVVVTRVEPGSPAEESGLQRGDVIRKVGREPVRDARELARRLSEGKELALWVDRRGGQLVLVLGGPSR